MNWNRRERGKDLYNIVRPLVPSIGVVMGMDWVSTIASAHIEVGTIDLFPCSTCPF